MRKSFMPSFKAAASSRPPAVTAPPRPPGSTKFKPPVKPGSELAAAYGQGRCNLGGRSVAPRSLHSEYAPDAFVLHWKTPDTEEVSVVVDPTLATKLRPHQAEGVKFIWEACMGLREGSPGRGCILADGAWHLARLRSCAPALLRSSRLRAPSPAMFASARPPGDGEGSHYR